MVEHLYEDERKTCIRKARRLGWYEHEDSILEHENYFISENNLLADWLLSSIKHLFEDAFKKSHQIREMKAKSLKDFPICQDPPNGMGNKEFLEYLQELEMDINYETESMRMWKDRIDAIEYIQLTRTEE